MTTRRRPFVVVVSEDKIFRWVTDGKVDVPCRQMPEVDGEGRLALTMSGKVGLNFSVSRPEDARTGAVTDAERLAVAILEGDDMAALVAADEVQMRLTAGEGFVPRSELLELLREIEWGSGKRYACPCCAEEDEPHAEDCRLARAIGAARSTR